MLIILPYTGCTIAWFNSSGTKFYLSFYHRLIVLVDLLDYCYVCNQLVIGCTTLAVSSIVHVTVVQSVLELNWIYVSNPLLFPVLLPCFSFVFMYWVLVSIGFSCFPSFHAILHTLNESFGASGQHTPSKGMDSASTRVLSSAMAQLEADFTYIPIEHG